MDVLEDWFLFRFSRPQARGTRCARKLSRNNLAKFLHEQGRLEEAEPLFREALQKCRGPSICFGFRRSNIVSTHSGFISFPFLFGVFDL